MKYDAVLNNVRIEKEKKEKFKSKCKAQGTTESQKIRCWIDEYIEQHIDDVVDTKEFFEQLDEVQQFLNSQEST